MQSAQQSNEQETPSNSTERAESNLKYRMPAPGFVWNPILKVERNRQCPCMSGKKFKRCCLPKLPICVPKDVAAKYKAEMSKPDFIFLTEENKPLIEKWKNQKTEEIQFTVPDE